MKYFSSELTEYLENQPLARERKNKDRAIVNLLLKRHEALRNAVEEKLISKELLITLVQEYNSMDRSWRKTLEERPDLRGSDYSDKAYLEQEAQSKLGYTLTPYKH